VGTARGWKQPQIRGLIQGPSREFSQEQQGLYRRKSYNVGPRFVKEAGPETGLEMAHPQHRSSQV